MSAFKFLIAVAGALALAAPSWAQPTATKSSLADNAALKYYQAFELMPKSRPETAKLFNEDWNTLPFDAALIKIVEESGNALKMAHRGARLQRCDWGFDFEDGPETLLPNVQKPRELMRFATLRARYRFETGKHNDGVDDVLDTLALAHHVGYKGPLISLLVSFAVETIAQETVARQLPKIDAKALDRLVAGLDKLPPRATFYDSVQADKEFGLVWLRTKLTGGNDALSMFLKLGLPLPPLGGKNPIKLLEELDPFFEEAGKLPLLAPEEAAVKLAELKTKVDANPFGKLLFPAINKVYEADCRLRARRQLFRAAIAVVQGGKEILADHPDPFGKGPFEYVEREGGFELKSKLINQNKPVTLIVGPQKTN